MLLGRQALVTAAPAAIAGFGLVPRAPGLFALGVSRAPLSPLEMAQRA
ncbi:MAG: hypothetical protein ABIQ70_00005 [Dokdonella sp.]